MKFLYLFIQICAYALISIHTSPAEAQQLYIGDPQAACYSNSNAGIYIGYDCNNEQTSCSAGLTIRSQYPYDTLSEIALLVGVDPNEIAQANPNYNPSKVLQWNQLVYVPITCTCQSDMPYSFKTTNYIVRQGDSSYFSLANSTFQGLATCQAIRVMNPETSLFVGNTMTIPLRCACPTPTQQNKGITKLYSYVVAENDNITSISNHLRVESQLILEANKLSEDSVVYSFTTLLIPVTDSTFYTFTPKAKASGASLSRSKVIKLVAIAAAAIVTLLGLGGAAIKLKLCGKVECCNNWVCIKLSRYSQRRKSKKRPNGSNTRNSNRDKRRKTGGK